MGLTSGFFLDAVIAAVIALPLVTVLLWGRLRGPRVIRQLQRLVLIALCQGVAVLLAALMINNSYQLYTSWSDLFGHNGPSGQIQAAKPVSLTSAQARSVDRPLPNAALFHPDSQMPGEVHAVITGAQSKVTGDVVVWLPPQYNQRQYAHTDFPVIQLLSGYPGSPGSWFRSLKVTDVLAAEVQRLAARPVILVGAAINVDPPHNPDCSDIPGGPRVATWLARRARSDQQLFPHYHRPLRLGSDGLLRGRAVRLQAAVAVPQRVRRRGLDERRRPPGRRPAQAGHRRVQREQPTVAAAAPAGAERRAAADRHAPGRLDGRGGQ
jgi:hypothetical protein